MKFLESEQEIYTVYFRDNIFTNSVEVEVEMDGCG